MTTTAIVVATYGNHAFTHSLMSDLIRERSVCNIELVVVDNHDPREPDRDTLNAEGPYAPGHDEHVLRPLRNLGWAGACNYAIDILLQEAKYDSVLLVDNDGRTSRNFVTGLRSTWESTGAGVVCPAYNDDWTHQIVDYDASAAPYRAVDRNRPVPFADGAAMFIPRSTIEAHGLLDVEFSPRYGWGIDIDYAMRVRRVGSEVRVTELSYFEHYRASTMSTIEPGYFNNADSEFRIAMAARYGPKWVDEVWHGFPLPDTYEELIGLQQ